MALNELSKEIVLIGIALDHKTTNENMQSATDIGTLWQKFRHENIESKIPGRSGEEIYAVYYNYDGDYTRPYSFFVGVPVNGDSTVPAGMTYITIQPGKYQKFTAKGKMPESIMSAWAEIWNAPLSRKYVLDYEVYDSRTRDMNNAEIDIYVSVE